eukprot:SAG11_NODE_930_length_6500_cov_4.853304_4_plen_84_part_00
MTYMTTAISYKRARKTWKTNEGVADSLAYRERNNAAALCRVTGARIAARCLCDVCHTRSHRGTTNFKTQLEIIYHCATIDLYP